MSTEPTADPIALLRINATGDGRLDLRAIDHRVSMQHEPGDVSVKVEVARLGELGLVEVHGEPPRDRWRITAVGRTLLS